MSNQIDLQKLIASANYAAQQAREANDLAKKNAAADAVMMRQMAEMTKNAQVMAQTMAQMSAQRTGGNPNLQYVENIPGRRVPFDQLVSIPIDANLSSDTQGSITINQDGPFIATARF